MSTQARWLCRLLHWLMAPMICVAMLFIGVGMAASLSPRYELLVSITVNLWNSHLCAERDPYRQPVRQPAARITGYGSIPATARRQGIACRTVRAHVHVPLVGWGMLSATRYPIVLYGPLRLPPILPHNLTLYAWLRDLHTDLAYLFFATFLAHFGRRFPRLDPARWRAREHGVVAVSYFCWSTSNIPRPNSTTTIPRQSWTMRGPRYADDRTS